MAINLTIDQKEILRKIVSYRLSGQLSEPIILAECMRGSEIIGIPGEFDPSLRGHMDILCDEDFLGFRINSNGRRIYTIKQRAYNAVNNDFKEDDEKFRSQINVGAYIHEMYDGNIQAIGLNNAQTIQETVKNKELLLESLSEIEGRLINSIQDELDRESFEVYKRNIEEIKTQLLDSNTDKRKANNILTTLSFLGDVEGTVGLIARVWPILYPLILIIAEMFK